MTKSFKKEPIEIIEILLLAALDTLQKLTEEKK